MRRIVERKTFSGAVCEIEEYPISDKVINVEKAEPHPRFKSEEERKRHRDGISRRNHVRRFNRNFSPSSLYVTLTFDDKHYVNNFPDARRIEDNYYRCVKRRCPDAKIMMYMGRGRKTGRIHFHMVCDGVPEKVIKKLWKYGSIIRIEHLRSHNHYNGVDHGQDYTGLANYLFAHWTEEQGGHRWKQSRNLCRPDQETAKVIKRLQRPPRAPKGYMFVESKDTEWGYLYFKYVRIPPRE